MEGSIPLWVVVVLGCVSVCFFLLLVMLFRMRRALRSFMTGKDAASLEATLQWLTAKIAGVDETLSVHKEALEFIDGRVKRSIRGYSLVRYDAYEGAGGEQSFSSSLLDEHGDGYVLSVVSNRNHTGVYAKKIAAGVAEASLTQEETAALREAKKGIAIA